MNKLKTQNSKNKKLNTNNGITLIALIITIIVMLILVAVTITMAVNGGLFGYAQKANQDMNQAIDAEQDLASGKVNVGGNLYNSIDDYIAGKVAVLSYEETAKYENGILKANAKYTDANTKIAIIPKGFKLLLDVEDEIDKGIVIQDIDGNEFVWIPVTYIAKNTDADDNGYDDGFDAVFYRSLWSNNNREARVRLTCEPLSPGGYTNEVAEYNDMVQSVYKNGGFYIGRYEAGTTTPRALYPSSNTEMTSAQRTSPLVVKRDAYPYNYVGWGKEMNDYTNDVLYTSGSIEYNQGKGALYLSKNMYTDKTKYGVTSTLCYGIQWDAMLDFVKDDTHNVTSSSSWGNHLDSSYTITRTTAQYYDSTNKTWEPITESGLPKSAYSNQYLLTTGAHDNFVAKNIFDVAGNTSEFTNEANLTEGDSYRMYHGSCFSAPTSFMNASYCYSVHANYCQDFLSFRPALHVSNE